MDQDGRDTQPKLGKHEYVSVLIVSNRTGLPGPRITLNKRQAAEIYQNKIDLLQNNMSLRTPSESLQGQSARISCMFDVSPKTIRDVWNRRTWQGATCHLWPEEDGKNVVRGIQQNVRGGSRDQVFISEVFVVGNISKELNMQQGRMDLRPLFLNIFSPFLISTMIGLMDPAAIIPDRDPWIPVREQGR
jgi:hypothetical protein